LFFFLRFKFSRLIYVGVRNLETINDKSDSADKTGNELFLLDTMTVPERVTVEKNVSGHG